MALQSKCQHEATASAAANAQAAQSSCKCSCSCMCASTEGPAFKPGHLMFRAAENRRFSFTGLTADQV